MGVFNYFKNGLKPIRVHSILTKQLSLNSVLTTHVDLNIGYSNNTTEEAEN